mgnify:CR=1 FL=1|jgi:hypothetical protein
MEWADGSAFNEGGMPRLWMHGTNVTEPFNVFTRWEDFSVGFHFGGPEAANDRAQNIHDEILGEDFDGVIIPVFCRATNPLRIPDLYTWEQHRVASALIDAGVIDEGEAEFLEESASAEMIFAILEEAGYDSLVYGNLCEHKEEVTDSICVWRAELLKSPFASSFDRDDPRLMPQLPTDERDMEMWRAMSGSIEAEKEALREFRAGRAAGITASG